jgi:cytochrome c biogenesis protein
MWRQLTSMRTALFLLLLLAIAAVPGSIFPQRTADPNGVVQYFKDNPTLAPVLDRFQVFDAYTSFWFSAIYLLLFISLIGCVIPRTVHHFRSLRTPPPRTPARLSRMSAFTSVQTPIIGADPTGQSTAAEVIASGRPLLRKHGYRVAIYHGTSPGAAAELSVSAERGYLRDSRPCDPRMARLAFRVVGDHRFLCRDVQLRHRQHLLPRPALLQRPLSATP